MREARLYSKNSDGSVDCALCAFRCHILKGKRGICGVRENRDGILNTLVYGSLIASNVDPVEKKPLFHFLPATTTYSIATAGCNFRCKHCQNFEISQITRESGDKAFSDDFYKKICGARLAPVLDSIIEMRRLGIWVEVTTLIIPGKNNSTEELREIAHWIYKTDKAIPWHISAFYPTYKLMDAPPTSPQDLIKAREIGLAEGLRYVYTGNIPGLQGESTYCFNCGALIIERRGYSLGEVRLINGKCPECETIIDGVWE